MNGLEMERHTDPNLADTNGNGIDDGVEYAMECEQSVLDPYYCVGVIPSDAQGAQSIPSITAMNPHPLASSDAGGYYDRVEYSVDLRDSAITLDGISSDWSVTSPLATDSQDTGPYDFKTLVGFTDEKYLYLRIDPYESFSTDEPVEFDIIIQTDSSPSRFQIYTLANERNKVHLWHPAVENSPSGLQLSYLGFEINNVFEIIIPLEFLGFPKTMTMDVSARIIEGSTRRIYDSFDPVTISKETNTAGPVLTPVETMTEPVATNTPSNVHDGSSTESGWQRYGWMALILGGAGILTVVGYTLRKKKN
jgi:hypothetical protein